MVYPTKVWDGDSVNRDPALAQKKSPDWRDWNRMIAEVAATQTVLNTVRGQLPEVEDIVPETEVTAENVYGVVNKTTLTFDDISIAVAEGSTKEFGSALLATFPAGSIHLLGAKVDLTLASSDYDGVEEGDLSLGVIAATDRALTGDDVTWMAAKEVTFAAEEAAVVGLGASSGAVSDSEGDLEVHLNLCMDQGGGAGTVVVSGTVELTWVNLGSVQTTE
ncbi:MAG: hypothetical protein WC942_08855 [Clostridia bacterium]|jgi:hypothetical protein